MMMMMTMMRQSSSLLMLLLLCSCFFVFLRFDFLCNFSADQTQRKQKIMSGWLLLVTSVLVISVVILVRLIMVMPGKQNTESKQQKDEKKKAKIIKTCVVLGSGGHTSEMCSLIQVLDPERYEFEFIVAQTDAKSEPFVRAQFLQQHQQQQQKRSLVFHRIPRSREVKQSYVTSIFTTMYALLYTTFLTLVKIAPDLVLVNGPGTCVPVCFSCYLLRLLGIKHVKFIYVESAARVKSLSLSGKILYRFMDRFLVQWPDLVHCYPRAEYIGRLC